MLGLETVVLLGVAPVACGALARQYPIAPAILLVLIGVLVRSNPHLKHAQLLPEVVLLSFPALLYWESLTTSLREIRNKPRVLPAESLLNDGTALRRGSTSTRCGSRTTTRPIEDGQLTASRQTPPMRIGFGLRLGIAVATCGLLAACAGTPHSSFSDGECVSRYDNVASAPTWPRLQQAMLRYDDRGHVASVRTQAKGDDLASAGDQRVVRVVDLLNHHGRRIAQVDVWRTDAGGWQAGIWSQCID